MNSIMVNKKTVIYLLVLTQNNLTVDYSLQIRISRKYP